jgi:pimeloyl-ACP methyl ester carboxylesterase
MLWWSLLADPPSGLDALDGPVVLAEGTADRIASGQTIRYVTMIPHSRFRLLAGPGHAPQSDVPDEITRLVHQAAA